MTGARLWGVKKTISLFENARPMDMAMHVDKTKQDVTACNYYRFRKGGFIK